MNSRMAFEHVVEQFSIIDALVIGLLVAAVIGLLLLWRSLRGMRRRLQERDGRIAAISEDLHAILECSRGLGQRMHQFDRQLAELNRRQEQVELQEGGMPTAEKVLKLLKQGYSVEDIATICDLSLSEVDLISSLANYQSVA